MLPNGDDMDICNLIDNFEAYRIKYRQNPCYETYRELSESYGKITEFIKKSDSPEVSQTVKDWHLKRLVTDEKNFTENPCRENAYDLCFTCTVLADLATAKGTVEGVEEAKKLELTALKAREYNFSVQPTQKHKTSLVYAYTRLSQLVKKYRHPAVMRKHICGEEKQKKFSTLRSKPNPTNKKSSCLQCRQEVFLHILNLCKSVFEPFVVRLNLQNIGYSSYKVATVLFRIRFIINKKLFFLRMHQ